MPTDVAIPEMGESVSEEVLLEWLKSEGDYVSRDEPICILETDKANVELPSPATGVLHPAQEVDATLTVGDLVATIDEGPPPAQSHEKLATQVSQPEPVVEVAPEEPAAEMLKSLSPAVRGLVQEHGIDPRQIVGTGRGGRIVKQDIVAVLKEKENEAVSAGTSATRASVSPPAPAVEPVVTVLLSFPATFLLLRTRASTYSSLVGGTLLSHNFLPNQATRSKYQHDKQQEIG